MHGVWSAMFLGMVLVTAGVCQAAPPELENRVFRVYVDQKPAGEYRMAIRQSGDTASVTAQADVRVRVLIVNYVYTFRGSEAWKGERLTRLDTNTLDDKKRFTVNAWSERDTLRVRSNGQERATSPDAWPTTYWRLPAAKFRNQNIALLDADTGKDIAASLRFVGMENVRAGAQVIQAAHWRLVGGVQVDLWYDAGERLVRQESVEEGHRTLMELVQVGP